MTWKDRHESKNKQDAMEALADLLSEGSTIEGNYSQSTLDDLAEAENFASQWQIPFSMGLYIKTNSQIENKRSNDDHPYWQSSNCY